jgi:ribosomal subunit interface protein
MLYQYHADGCEITDVDKALIEEKLGKLAKYGRIGDESTKIHVNLVRGTRHESPNYGIRVHITLPGDELIAEASGAEIADATDAVEEKLRHQAEKLKD